MLVVCVFCNTSTVKFSRFLTQENTGFRRMKWAYDVGYLCLSGLHFLISVFIMEEKKLSLFCHRPVVIVPPVGVDV